MGVPLDEREAADWFIKAHAAGAKNAAELAGRLLSWRPEQHVEAVQWLLVATKYGCESAYDNLAGIYEDRRSPLYNPAEAFYCWTQVAATPRGHRRYHAMYTLARWCRDGIGTERNLEEAKRWLDRLMALAPKDKSDYREAAALRRRMDEELF